MWKEEGGLQAVEGSDVLRDREETHCIDTDGFAAVDSSVPTHPGSSFEVSRLGFRKEGLRERLSA